MAAYTTIVRGFSFSRAVPRNVRSHISIPYCQSLLNNGETPLTVSDNINNISGSMNAALRYSYSCYKSD